MPQHCEEVLGLRADLQEDKTLRRKVNMIEVDFIHLAGLPRGLWIPKIVVLHKNDTLLKTLGIVGFKQSDISVSATGYRQPFQDKTLDSHFFTCPIQALLHWSRDIAFKGAVSHFNDRPGSSLTQEVLIGSYSMMAYNGKVLPYSKSIQDAKDVLIELYRMDPEPIIQIHTSTQYLTVQLHPNANDLPTKEVVCRATLETSIIVLAPCTVTDIEGLCDAFNYLGGQDALQALLTSGVGSSLVKGCEGCHNNASGVPVHRLSTCLTALALYHWSLSHEKHQKDLGHEFILDEPDDRLWEEMWSFLLPPEKSQSWRRLLECPLSEVESYRFEKSHSGPNPSSDQEDDAAGI